MLLCKVVSNYLHVVSLQCKRETLSCYRNHLYQVLQFCSLKNFETTSDIDYNNFAIEFIEYCKSKNLSNRTINKRLQYFSKALTTNNFKGLKRQTLTVPYKRFNSLSREEVLRILDFLEKLPNDNQTLSFKVAVYLLLDTGVRINELLNIFRANIYIEENTILLTVTKTDVERFVFFTDRTKKILYKYLSIPTKSVYLLQNFNRKTRLSYKSIIIFFDKIKKECNINQLSPHMFRHTFCTLLYENDTPIITIKELAGHKDIRVTMNYVHSSIKKSRNDYNKYYKIK